MRFKIIPEACAPHKDEKSGEEKPSSFEGHIILDMPSYPVLCQKQKEATMAMAKAKENMGKEENQFDSIARSLEATQEIFKILEPMILEVELKHLKSGTEIKSKDDFICFPYCKPIIEELCLKLMFGFVEKN